MLRELRLGVRSLRRSPGFTLVSILVLAVGIGASASVFSVVHGVLLKALPFTGSDRLFAVHEVVPKFSHIAPLLPVSARHFAEWREKSRSVEGIAIFGPADFVLTGGGEAERLPGAGVSAGFFPALGVGPRLGRLFRPEEDAPGRDRVVVLSDSLWKQRFHSDPNILGRRLWLNGEPAEVIGVLGEEVSPRLLKDLHPISAEGKAPLLWKPLGIRPEDVGPIGDFNYAGLVRLKPGVDPRRAAAELSSLADAVTRQAVPDADLRVALVPLQEQIGAGTRRSLLVLLAAVAMVLLIVSITVANLLLARGLARVRELSVRTALGASRRQLVFHVLAETALLALAGGAAGVLLAWTSLPAVLAHTPVELPRMDDIRIDGPVLAFALGLTFLATLLSGILPAWRFSRQDPQDALKSRTSGAARGSGRIRQALVAGQVALSMVCLVAAGLLLNSFLRVNAVEKGFRTERILTLDVPLVETRYPDDAARAAALRRIIGKVEVLPGVQAVGISNRLPLNGEGSNNTVHTDGMTLPLLERPVADFRYVNSAYFETFAIPVRQGRAFAESDGNRRVAVISAGLAARLWGAEAATGRRFRMGAPDSPAYEVVGVAGDVRSNALDKAPALTVYFPYWQRSRTRMSLAVRTAMDPAGIGPAVRAALRETDPQIAPGEMKTMVEIVSATTAARRFQAVLVGFFAAIAVVLACLGVYGVVAYAMTQRRAEFGVRLALGATRAAVVGAGLRQALMPVVFGITGGLAASVALGAILRGLLFGVEPRDPATLAVTAALFGSVALAACAVPVLQASRIDPARMLRDE